MEICNLDMEDNIKIIQRNYHQLSVKKKILDDLAEFNTLRPRQNGHHFADNIFKHIFLSENAWISIKISLKFVPRGQINNIRALVQIMVWCQPNDKPLSEPMMIRLLTHAYLCHSASMVNTICVLFVNKIWWLCLVPNSTTRFASEVGYRMAKIWSCYTRKFFLWTMTSNSLTENEEHDIPSHILKTIFGSHASVIF